MAIPLRAGRSFEDADRTGSPEVVIINEDLAHRLWPNEDPVGKTIVVPDQGTLASRQIVGIVGATRHHGLATEPTSEIYRPAYQAYWPWFTLVVHSATEPARLTKAVRDAVTSIDTHIPIDAVRTMESLAADSIALRRSSMLLLAALAVMASLLASFGVYSVIAYTVAQRTKDIGIRMALGATPRDVARKVVGEGMILAGIGLGIGLVLSAALTRFLASLLFGVQPTDALTFGAVSLVIFTVAVTAAMVPALSASRVDPIIALRAE
jgi:putative ABC transport system permease protein